MKLVATTCLSVSETGDSVSAASVRCAFQILSKALLTNALFSGLSESKMLCGPGGTIGTP
jgi:hypothetical protein